jgi:hypothetical protein
MLPEPTFDRRIAAFPVVRRRPFLTCRCPWQRPPSDNSERKAAFCRPSHASFSPRSDSLVSCTALHCTALRCAALRYISAACCVDGIDSQARQHCSGWATRASPSGHRPIHNPPCSLSMSCGTLKSVAISGLSVDCRRAWHFMCLRGPRGWMLWLPRFVLLSCSVGASSGIIPKRPSKLGGRRARSSHSC